MAYPMEDYYTGTGQNIVVHPARVCSALLGQTEYCVIHKPDPRFDGWPTNWRGDTGVMEVLCPHGIGHPVRAVPPAPGWSLHGCDGCCRKKEEEMPAPLVHTGAPGDEQKYLVRQGGLMRCCLSTLANYHANPVALTGEPVEGQVLSCMYCSSSMVFVGGAWEWNKAKTDYTLRSK